MDISNNLSLGFLDQARETFQFLNEQGFSEIEASPTLIRYRKGDVEVDIYHGRQSYEIGAGITAFGNRYPIVALIRHTNPEFAKRYRNYAATTPEEVTIGLKELSKLVKCYGKEALNGDNFIFFNLEQERNLRSQEYALDVLAYQLRPQANDAFRQKDYKKAAELYFQIKERLSPAEIKKLSFAKKHVRP